MISWRRSTEARVRHVSTCARRPKGNTRSDTMMKSSRPTAVGEGSRASAEYAPSGVNSSDDRRFVSTTRVAYRGRSSFKISCKRQRKVHSNPKQARTNWCTLDLRRSRRRSRTARSSFRRASGPLMNGTPAAATVELHHFIKFS